jgi:Domain of Unknown Function (DUF1540)
MTTEMAKVQDCSALACVHNRTWRCRAQLITVGKQGIPACDTYAAETAKSAESEAGKDQGVGACDMYRCLRNRDRKCIAYTIKVRFEDGTPRCKTFKNRYK